MIINFKHPGAVPSENSNIENNVSVCTLQYPYVGANVVLDPGSTSQTSTKSSFVFML